MIEIFKPYIAVAVITAGGVFGITTYNESRVDNKIAVVKSDLVTQIKETERRLSDDISQLNNRMDRLNNRMDRLNNRMDRLESKIDLLITHNIKKDNE